VEHMGGGGGRDPLHSLLEHHPTEPPGYPTAPSNLSMMIQSKHMTQFTPSPMLNHQSQLHDPGYYALAGINSILMLLQAIKFAVWTPLCDNRDYHFALELASSD
jgi:hypothetical protein